MLERELRELRVEWPATPDLAGSLVLDRPRRRYWLPAWQVAVAAVLVLVAVVMAVPPTRAAVLDLLGLRSVKIERREPTPAFGASLQLGDPVTLEAARRAVDFPLLVPAALGRPDGVFLSDGRVDMVYRGRPRVLVTELRASVTPVIQKAVGSASRFEELSVDGDPAYFIAGADHGFAYLPPGGSMGFEQQRLAGPTLLVERSDGVLARIEGRLSRAEAVRIAESLR